MKTHNRNSLTPNTPKKKRLLPFAFWPHGLSANIPLVLIILVSLAATSGVEARTKLVALPERAATVIRLDNPDATLIEEERTLNLQEGINQIDFSWEGVRVDSDSIQLSFVTHADKTSLLNVSYPPGENALVWEVDSAEVLQAVARIRYLLSGLDRVITYTAVADKEETKLESLKSHLVLRNFSGEDFSGAQVVLDYGDSFTLDSAHEETRSLLSLKKLDVPFVKTWTWDARRLPWDPEQVDGNIGIPVTYEIANTEASKLGTFELWRGKVRIFQNDGSGSTIFLGEDRMRSDFPGDTIPVGETMEMSIGDSRDIVVTQRKMLEKQINVRRNNHNRIILHDTDEWIEAELENFKDKPARLVLVQTIPGQWKISKASHDYELKDASTLEFAITLPPKSKTEFSLRYNRLNVR